MYLLEKAKKFRICPRSQINKFSQRYTQSKEQLSRQKLYLDLLCDFFIDSQMHRKSQSVKRRCQTRQLLVKKSLVLCKWVFSTVAFLQILHVNWSQIFGQKKKNYLNIAVCVYSFFTAVNCSWKVFILNFHRFCSKSGLNFCFSHYYTNLLTNACHNFRSKKFFVMAYGPPLIFSRDIFMIKISFDALHLHKKKYNLYDSPTLRKFDHYLAGILPRNRCNDMLKIIKYVVSGKVTLMNDTYFLCD